MPKILIVKDYFKPTKIKGVTAFANAFQEALSQMKQYFD